MGKQQYLGENEKIRRLVPKNRLLEYNVRLGWEPLCKFPGREIPDEPCPRRNDMVEFNALMAYLITLQYQEFWGNFRKRLGGLVGVGVVALGVYLAWRRGLDAVRHAEQGCGIDASMQNSVHAMTGSFCGLKWLQPRAERLDYQLGTVSE